MEKLLKPHTLNVDPCSKSAAKEWKHWLKTFENYTNAFIESLPAKQTKIVDKLEVLINCVSHQVYEHIEECKSYDDAIRLLDSLYVKTSNKILARYLLATAKQDPGQSIDGFLQSLIKLSNDCNFAAVTDDEYREEMIRDAFIKGINSNSIQQQLLENGKLSLEQAVQKAKTLGSMQKTSEANADTGGGSEMTVTAREKTKERKRKKKSQFQFSSTAATTTNNICTSTPQDSSDDDHKPARSLQVRSDSVLYTVTTVELHLLGNSEQANQSRRKKNFARAKGSGDVLDQLTVDERKINEIQKILAESMYGDDVFKFFRHFHPNADKHISDMNSNNMSVYERVNQVFAVLKKLGTKTFNPNTIHLCLIEIRCQNYADSIQHIVEKQSKSETSSAELAQSSQESEENA